MDLGIHCAPPDPSGLVLVTVTGDLDDETAGELSSAVARHLGRPAAHLLLDLTGTGFLSSAGVRALLECRDAALAAGCTLRVTGPQPGVHRVLEIVGVLSLLGLGPAPAVPGQRPRPSQRPPGSPGDTMREAQTTRSEARAAVREAQTRAKAGDILRTS